MKKLYLVLAAVLGVILYLHRAAVHQVVVDTAIGVAALAGLSLAAAVVVRLASSRKARPVRQRPAAVPATIERLATPRPAAPCAEACGRPATRMFGQWPVCDECGGRLDAAAGHAQRPASLAASGPEPAGDDLPVLTQPPVIPSGETIGQVDMTDFENRGTL